MPKVGKPDLFESSYRKELDRRLDRYGVLVEYRADRAALDGGLHLYKPRDLEESDEAEVSDVRIWFQCKGIQASTLSADDLASRDDVAVTGLTLDHVQFWYSAGEPVYLIVYLQAVDDFLAVDVRDHIDGRGGGMFLQQLRADGQETLTLRIPRGATLEHALAAMPRHRSLRIDGPAFRGRPLGHRFDPLRSWLDTMEPDLFAELIGELLEAHDFRPKREIDIAPLLDRDIGVVTATVGTLYLTYEWTFPGATEFGVDPGTDFRIEAKPESAHGDVLLVCHSRVDESPRRTDDLAGLVAQLQEEGIARALVFFNESEMGAGAGLFGSWRVALEPLVHTSQGVDSLGFNVLTTTLVYLAFADRLRWRILNYL
jgi:hypothetical protein